jgi:hypothetical protein
MKLLPSLLAGALMLGLAGVAEAGTATTTFPVTATVVPACAVSAQNITFPSVGNISSASGFTGVQAQTTLNLECNYGRKNDHCIRSFPGCRTDDPLGHQSPEPGQGHRRGLWSAKPDGLRSDPCPKQRSRRRLLRPRHRQCFLLRTHP